MRVNVYAEEMTDRVEVISKTTEDGEFTGLRIYLELPVTVPANDQGEAYKEPRQVKGPFMHRTGDDDSSAVTFWGKKDLRTVLQKALDALDAHHIAKDKTELAARSEWSRMPHQDAPCNGGNHFALGWYKKPADAGDRVLVHVCPNIGCDLFDMETK